VVNWFVRPARFWADRGGPVIGGAIINDAGKHDVNSFGDRPGWVEENALEERDAIGSRSQAPANPSAAIPGGVPAPAKSRGRWKPKTNIIMPSSRSLRLSRVISGQAGLWRRRGVGVGLYEVA